jgi:hypothetical protein
MPATELAFRPDVNVSIATGNGRFSTVDQWPVLGVHRGPVSGDLFVSLAAFSIPAKSPCSVICKRSPFGSSKIASINARMASTAPVRLGERDDVHVSEGRTLEESGGVFLIPAESIGRFGEDNVESLVQRITH